MEANELIAILTTIIKKSRDGFSNFELFTSNFSRRIGSSFEFVLCLSQEKTTMNLHIHIPDHLNSILTARAAKCGEDIETFVVDSICEQLEVPDSAASSTASEFDSWLVEVRKLFSSVGTDKDDSRDSIYAGRGELEFSWIQIF